MNIIYFIDHLRPDGTQCFLAQLISGLADRGHHQTVFCLNDSWDDEVVNFLRSVGTEVRIIGKLSLASGVGITSVLCQLKRSSFDVAVTLLLVADILGRTLAKIACVPRIVSSLRARNMNYSRLQCWLARITIGAADAVVINSAGLRTFAIDREGAVADRIHVIPNGVDVEKFSNPLNRAIVCKTLGLPKAGPLLGTVGRLTKQKGFDVLLEAVSLTRHRDWTLLVFGSGEEEPQLRALTRKLGLESQVCFPGYRHDLPRLLGALDLYVHPARFEGMPNAVLEAMAAACPVVATAVDGSIELIEDGKHGWLVQPENSQALAEAIDEAINDPREARRRGFLARDRVRDSFSVDSMVDAWEVVLGGGACVQRSGN